METKPTFNYSYKKRSKEHSMNYSSEIVINGRIISSGAPTYFIADIAANHDGDLGRAKDLIWLAKESGADCAKFQHFLADRIVSDVGFSGALSAVSHQSGWESSVVDVYDQYHTKREWSEELFDECLSAEIDFMTTPYDIEAIHLLDKYLPAYKIGSGDITFKEIMIEIAKKNKPTFLASGASDITDVQAAVELILEHNSQLCLMQCNTNYTGSIENFKYVNLNVIRQFAISWPNMILGLSDHTPGHSAVLGAVSLGARVIEKHFTDRNERIGPDHKFALNPKTWSNMVNATRELEFALGDGIKRIEANEQETVLIQRRALRAVKDLSKGQTLISSDLEALRPCPDNAVSPMAINQVVGKKLTRNLKRGEHIQWNSFE